MTLSKNDTPYINALHFSECRYPECRILFTAMLSVLMLGVIMLNVVMLSVVAPPKQLEYNVYRDLGQLPPT